MKTLIGFIFLVFATVCSAQVVSRGHGGTGPFVSSDSGKFLMSNGTLKPTWQTVSGGGGTPAGSNQSVQFNQSGAFGGNSLLTFDYGNGYLNILGSDGNGQLRMWNNSHTFYTAIQYGGSATRIFNLPNNDGASGQLLSTDGSGNTSWVNPVTTGTGAPSGAPAQGVINYIDTSLNSLWVWTGAAWFGPYVPTP